jgi:imidazole glycerol-phosphate synthase subunit HisH
MQRDMVTIVDYGMGNLGSIQNMFKRIGVRAQITGDAAEVARAEKILLPGVGAFDAAMARIERSGLRPVLDHKALEEKVPILGICLGMQLLTRGSDEGNLPGLGWIAASTHRFDGAANLKVPHMGWNLARPINPSPLTHGLGSDARFYFVHSFYVCADQDADRVLRTRYGVEFDSAISHGNIHGAQFHPEKSHKFGMQLLANFAGL